MVIEGVTSTKTLFNNACQKNGHTMITFPKVILQRWSINIRVYRSFEDNEIIFRMFAAQSPLLSNSFCFYMIITGITSKI